MDQKLITAQAATRKLRDPKRKVRLEIIEDRQHLATRPPDILFVGGTNRDLEEVDIAEIEKICAEPHQL